LPCQISFCFLNAERPARAVVPVAQQKKKRRSPGVSILPLRAGYGSLRKIQT
jgi:hypothetical protein